MSTTEILRVVQECRLNAAKLRAAAGQEPDLNLQRLLLEAAHHLEVGVRLLPEPPQQEKSLLI